MIAFIAVFFSIYALLHYYLYKKVVNAVRLKVIQRRVLMVLLAVNTLSPAIWRTIDRFGIPDLTFITAFSSLFLMGVVIYFFLSGVVLDIIAKLTGLAKATNLKLTLLATILLSVYSHLETYNLEVLRYEIKTPKLPPGMAVKILHISDLHLGPTMREGRVNMVLEIYRKEKPDLVVATGDMVDGNMRGHDGLAELLAEINPPLGKFAVLGNHEFYRGYLQAIDFLERAGFRLLRGEGVKVGEHLFIAGVDDPTAERFGYTEETDELRALRNADPDRFILFIKHQPRLRKEAINRIDLFLGGHTHGGVLFFVGYTILRLMFFTDRGMVEIAPEKYAIVSKGVGTGGPPMRLLSPPDVVIVELRGQSQ